MVELNLCICNPSVWTIKLNFYKQVLEIYKPTVYSIIIVIAPKTSVRKFLCCLEKSVWG